MARKPPEYELIDGPYTRFKVKRQVGPADDRAEVTHEIVRELDEEDDERTLVDGVEVRLPDGPMTVSHVPVDHKTFAEFWVGLERAMGALELSMGEGPGSD